MPTKYYEGIRKAQKNQKPADQLRAFDPDRLRTRNLAGKLVSRFLENPRWALRLVRSLKPNLKIGPILFVTKNVDVREVMEREDIFETPFGPEMTEMAGGSNFILGMRDGEEYRRLKSATLSAFPMTEAEDVVRPMAAMHSRDIMLKAAGRIDVVDKILKIVPVRICRDYYGLTIEDEVGFADRAIALSSLFFADFFGSQAVRELAVVAAHDMRATIDRSIDSVRRGAIASDTPLARLVTMHDKEPAKLTIENIHSIMTGMITGFMPTNLLAGGNCLDVVLDRQEAQNAIEEAIEANDNKRLESAIVEAMRFKPINIGPLRYARQDAVIAKGSSREYHVKKGTTLIPSTLSAMFDPEAVSSPETYDPTRPASNYMVFGHGIHWCIGAAVAKIQIAEAFRVIFSKQNVRRAKGSAGKLGRRGAFPENLSVEFDMPANCRIVEQSMITLCFPVDRHVDIAKLRDRISALGNPCHEHLKSKLDETGIVHFTSLAIVGSGTLAGPSEKHPAQLVWEISADGPSERAIEALARATEEEFRTVFENACGLSEETAFEDFLGRYEVVSSPFSLRSSGVAFAGTPGHSVRRIRAEAELGKSLSKLIRNLSGTSPAHAAGLMDTARRFLAETGNYDWAFQPAESLLEQPGGTVRKAIIRTIASPKILGTLAAVLVVFSVLNYAYLLTASAGNGVSVSLTVFRAFVLAIIETMIVFLSIGGMLAWLLRRAELADQVDNSQVPFERYKQIVERENRLAQNHLTGLSVMKAGLLRRFALMTTFEIVNAAASYFFRPGYLADINTIHFARWLLLPDTNRLLFLSNYDGSWESYLEDFITKAHKGLTGVWSNTVGFPATKFLFWKGAEDGDRFKRWARIQQAPTLFWYSAYPDLDTHRIRINSAIRQGLVSVEGEREAQDWLSLFGSRPRPASTLETNDIQSLVFGPMGSLEHAEMIGFDIPGDPSRSSRRAWLEWLTERITFGERKPDATAMIAAFSASGLTHFGLGESTSHNAIADFPPAFRQGMADEPRARILGDVGENGFDNWIWGTPAKPVDVVVICYAAKRSELENRVRELTAQSSKAGLSIATRMPMMVTRKGNNAVEPFGFADGISQPLIKGTLRAAASRNSMHLVAPGEFILGYKDERGTFPPSPLVPAFLDKGSVLSSPPEQQKVRNLPDELARMRDFGCNGSFMVIRQLQQHADEFDAFCVRAARELKEKADRKHDVTPEWIGAKMVGRWQDGSSLVRNPFAKPGQVPDNEFLFGSEDPQGVRCPLGAHIRRANPRDSLGSDHVKQIQLVNRHRILRVGRRYEQRNDPKGKIEKGLIFICLNASIERQFEFVQQTWIGAKGFQGLEDESDPLASNPVDNGQFTIPTEDGMLIATKLRNFVSVRGGGYFFMPGRRALVFLASQL